LLDDMRSNALDVCLRGLHYFDKSKGSGFSFITMNLILGINGAIAEYKKKIKDANDEYMRPKYEFTRLEYDANDNESVVIPIWDDEVEVNSNIYNSLPEEQDEMSFNHLIRIKIERNIGLHKRRAKSMNITFEEYLLSIKAKQIKTEQYINSNKCVGIKSTSRNRGIYKKHNTPEERKQAKKESQRIWHLQNRDQLKEKYRNYYLLNKDALQEKSRKYYNNNTEACNQKAREARAKRKAFLRNENDK
jgi:hypothetical protein